MQLEGNVVGLFRFIACMHGRHIKGASFAGDLVMKTVSKYARK